MNFLYLLLGLAALLAIADNFFCSSDNEAEEEDPSEEPEPTTVTGTDGDDLLIGRGGQIIEALDGDDTIIATGDDFVFAGPGNDVIIALGAADIFGGEGEDTFIISPQALDANDASWPVIRDFSPDEDAIVIDLTSVDLGDTGTEENPILLTGVLAPDGEGLMIQVNGLNIVQLSNFGGDDMQAALEDLVNDFVALDIVGAEFEFPEEEDDTPPVPEDDGAPPDPEDDDTPPVPEDDDTPPEPEDDDTPPSPFPAGLTVTEEENGDVVIALTDEFLGGGSFIGGDEFSILDLSALTRDMVVTVLSGDVLVVEPIDGSQPATTFEQIDRVILGNGDDVFDGGVGSGFVEAVAGNGNDTLVATNNNNQNILSGAGFMRVDGETETIDGIGQTLIFGGAGNDILSGGLGDILSGGPGADTFQIFGVGAEGAGPALITDFNPVQFDRLVYTPVNLNESNPSPEVVILQDDFSTAIVENGQTVVVLQGIGSFDDPNITINEPVTRLPV